MNINIDSLTGKEKQPLTRADIEERLRQAGSSMSLNLAGETIAPQSNLRSINLRGANLSGAILSETDLSRAILILTNLSRTSLILADLSGANLSGAILSGAILSGAILSRADLSEAILSETILSRAILSRADLSRANLILANLSRATLSEATLSETNLSGAILSGADLSETNLRGANLSGANLSGANLSRAILILADLSGANLSGANLSGANLSGAIFSGAIFSGATLTIDDLLINANFTDAILDRNEKKGQKQQSSNLVPTLRIRIEEEPLIASHLSDVLEALTSLYVKMWLLQQNRFDDFLLYTEHKERRFEEEARLYIAELTYNSPVNIKFDLGLSPKSLVEALQMFVDIIAHRKHRERIAAAESRSKDLDNQLKEETVKREQLKTAEQCLETAKHMVEALYPTLNEEQKALAINSMLKDILKLTQDPTLEVSLTVPLLPLTSQPVSLTHPSTKAQQQSTQP